MMMVMVKTRVHPVVEGLMMMTIEKIKFDYLSEARLRAVSVESWESGRRGD